MGDLQPDETVDAMHEANLLRNLDHPGIVKFHDSFIDQENFCIITEYCEVRDPADVFTSLISLLPVDTNIYQEMKLWN